MKLFKLPFLFFTILYLSYIVSFAQDSSLQSGIFYAFDLKDTSRQFMVFIKPNAKGFSVKRIPIDKELIGTKSLKSLELQLLNEIGKVESFSRLSQAAYQSSLNPGREFIYHENSDSVSTYFRYQSAYYYELDSSILKKEKNFNLYGIHGYAYSIDNGFYKDISFSYNNYNSGINSDFIDGILIMGESYSETKKKVASMNYSEEIERFYQPEKLSSGCANPNVNFQQNKPIQINKNTGEVRGPFRLTISDLPNKTMDGVSIDYTKEAIWVKLVDKSGNLIKKSSLSLNTRNKDKLFFTLSDFYYGILKSGVYQLQYSIYDNAPFFKTNFEVLESEKNQLSSRRTYSLK